MDKLRLDSNVERLVVAVTLHPWREQPSVRIRRVSGKHMRGMKEGRASGWIVSSE